MMKNSFEVDVKTKQNVCVEGKEELIKEYNNLLIMRRFRVNVIVGVIVSISVIWFIGRRFRVNVIVVVWFIIVIIVKCQGLFLIFMRGDSKVSNKTVIKFGSSAGGR